MAIFLPCLANFVLLTEVVIVFSFAITQQTILQQLSSESWTLSPLGTWPKKKEWQFQINQSESAAGLESSDNAHSVAWLLSIVNEKVNKQNAK